MSDPNIYLLILWNQHQPRYFKDPTTGEYTKPWVRLHCTKDYYDMAAMLEKYPQVHCVINLTPSLISQIRDMIAMYESGKPTDIYMRLTLKPADALTDSEKLFIAENFFSANWRNMIDRYPRYHELRLKRRFKPDGSLDVEATLNNYTVQDWRDLQVWFNLTWVDPSFHDDTVELPTGKHVTVRHLIEKGCNFTEHDKRELMDTHIEIMRAVLPIHKKLRDSGQIELVTTPFYHPILPLLCDNGMGFRYPEDADTQVRKAITFYKEIFGTPPTGMWPAEGAVSESVIPIFARNGIKWIASDEQVLARTLGKGYCSAHEKYRPYIAVSDTYSVYIIFRDTRLSDAIGFVYSGMDPQAAVDDFIANLESIRRQFVDSKYPPLVSVILDGENPWENYPNDGRDFLNELYSRLQNIDWITPVTLTEFLSMFTVRDTLYNLHAGSWIAASFDIWVGEPEENLAWEYLLRVRLDMESWANVPAASWEAIYAAEGSDWFWWYGRDQYARDERVFDEMFRNTLKTVYLYAGKQPPEFLDERIIK